MFKFFSHPKRSIAQKAIDKHHMGYDEKDDIINFERDLYDANRINIEYVLEVLSNTSEYLNTLVEKNIELTKKLESYNILKNQVVNLLPYIDTGTFSEFCDTDDYGCIISDIISKLNKMEEKKDENN